MRKAIVMAMVALLALTLAAPAASAKAEHMPASWLQATCAVSGGELALSGGSIHVRNELHSDVIYMNFGEGYVAVGENAILFDYDVSLNTMNGRGGGQFDVALGFLPAPAGFSGHFNGHIGPDGLRARAVGQGSGVFDGDWLKATIEQFQPTSEQLEWMCGGEMVYKAVAVTATIIDK